MLVLSLRLQKLDTMSFQVAPICQRGGLDAGSTATSTTTETTTERPKCPHGWETYTDDGSSVKCFKYSRDTLAYATYAEDNCRVLGGHLASIHSMAEQNFLMQTFNPPDGVWIGAVDTDHNQIWEWTDESSFDFSYWRSGEPIGGEYHTVMTSYSGEWNDIVNNNSCGYICQLTL